MRILATLFTFLILCATSQARIGETIAECEKRYGKHQTSETAKPGYDEARIYVKNGIAIMIGFQGQEAVLVIYSKFKDRKVLAMSDQEIETLLAANAGGKKWFPDREKKKTWERVGGQRASYEKNALTIYSRKYKEAILEEVKKPKHLEGF